jgi:hypothetical protein
MLIMECSASTISGSILLGDEVSGVVQSVSDGPAQGADPWSGKIVIASES